MRTSLHHLLAHAAAENGQAPALSYQKTTLCYSALWGLTQDVAGGLMNLDLAREERVGVFLEKRVEAVTGVFGTAAAGGAFVPINPLLRPAQVAYILHDCEVAVLITSSERFELLADELAQCRALRHVVVIGTDRAQAQARAGSHFRLHLWSEVFGKARSEPLVSSIDVDMAAIFYTSGSTGKPKGVVLSHRNLIVGAESVSTYLANDRHDVILSALPLSFDAGFSQLTTAFSVGAHVILMNYLLPADVVRLCSRYGVTGLTSVPPLWIQIAEQEWPPEVSAKLRYFANTGGRMPKSTLDKLRALFPKALPFLMYGLTEAFRSTYLDPAEVDSRPDSIGKAIPNAEVLVVRPDDTVCDPGEKGELVHRGALVALGYWNDAERTAARFRPAPGRRENWRSPELAVYSGDLVVADEEGFLYFVGRTDEMIKTSGYRVSPTEIEEVAYETGLVRDVVALGIDDARLGQRVAMVASGANSMPLDIDALLQALRRRLPSYMVPGMVVERSDLPRSPNGKFDRRRIREELTS